MNFKNIKKIRCDVLDLRGFNKFDFSGKIYVMEKIYHSELLRDKIIYFKDKIYNKGIINEKYISFDELINL